MKVTIDIPEQAKDYLRAGAASVTYYPRGFVPNSYKYPAPATRYHITMDAQGNFEVTSSKYDRKRSFGAGRTLVPMTAKGGVFKPAQ